MNLSELAISRRELRKLLGPRIISSEILNGLRRLAIPQDVKSGDLRFIGCLRMVEQRFSELEGIDHDKMGEIKKSWIRRVFRSATPLQLRHFLGEKEFWRMAQEYPGAAIQGLIWDLPRSFSYRMLHQNEVQG